MHTRGRKPFSLLLAFVVLGVAATVFAASPASAATTTTVVSYDSLSPNGQWALEPSSNTGTFGFVNGPAPTPGGTGSLAMTIASGQHEWLNNYAYGVCAAGPACNSPASMTPIANFDALSYSTYRASGTVVPTFSIEIYTTGTANYTTLVFIPTNALVLNGVWQTWDTMNPLNGAWWSSRNVGSGVFNCAPFACSASWSQITASYPSAKVVFGLGPNVGSGGTFNGNVDNFTVGVSGDTTIYDFERVECTTVCYVDPAGNDANTGTLGAPLRTIQAGVNKVQAGGTVSVAAGTFTENVVLNKTVDIDGAGASTVVVPAVSNPNCGGAGGGSLCAGASNVFLVQANGVEIEDLTVDGDNPSLTGLAIGGADVDARNGIITNHTAGLFNGLSVHDVTVKNIYLRGMYASSGGTFDFSNNTVDNVQGETASIGIFNFAGAGTMAGNFVTNANDAISANHSRGTTFTGNTVASSASGIHTDNAGDGGGPADVISGNNVTSCTTNGYGIWTFVPYIAPTISNNVVSGCFAGLAAFASCNFGGTNHCPGGVVPTVPFSGNQVNGIAGGRGLIVSTSTGGFGDGDVKVQADHNTLTGGQWGVMVEETAPGTTAAVTANRNSLGGNSLRGVKNFGGTTVDAKCNWWGQTFNPALLIAGPVTAAPWLVTSDLNGNCVPIMTVGILPRAVAEGNSGTKAVSIGVSLDRASSQPITVQWHTEDDSATAPSDYVAASGMVTFAPGTLSQTITVTTKGDTQLEDHESFNIKLHNVSGAVLANKTKIVRLLNDEKPTMILFGGNNSPALEGGFAGFHLHLNQRYRGSITVTVSSANGSATAPGDYAAIPGGTTVTFAPEQTDKTVLVQTNTDGQSEPDETFTMTFSSPDINNSPVVGTGTILANDD